MTNPNYCVLALCVDRSGSMLGVKDDAEGAVRFIIEAQKDVPGRCGVMMCDFSDRWNLVYSLREVQDAPGYFLIPQGGTALLDAIAQTIIELGEQLAALPQDERPAKVIVAIQTDGAENSSKKFTLSQVREMIAHQQSEYGWEILFLGADMDAVTVGASYGLQRGRTFSYDNTSGGTYSMAEAVNTYVTSTRSGQQRTLTPDDTSA